MIIGKHRDQVIENIRAAVLAEDFYAKVEVDDPVLTVEDQREITHRYLHRRNTYSYKLKSFAARTFANFGSDILNRKLEIEVQGDLKALEQGCILTSNHFGPLENTILRRFVRASGKKRLNVVSQVSNLAMTGPIGFLMNYADTVPLLEEPRYLSQTFLEILGGMLQKKEPVLIYPEQEMWFNYRKPRPMKRGAYYFAAKLGVPVVCCFVEMVETQKQENDHFRKLRYVLHVLDTLYPDPEKSPRQNSFEMCKKDQALKNAAYERAYGKPLTYDFTPHDIAGWMG